MSKIFCEICGTAYSDTASQCPICGCPKPETAEFDTDTGTESTTESRGQSAVRGGRFSKSNVNKRVKAAASAEQKKRPARRSKKASSSAERGLIITIILLLLAIAVVVGYIIINYFLPRTPADNPADSTPPAESTTPPTVQTLPTVPPTTEPQVRPCTALKLSEESIRFNQAGTSWLLNVIPTPANTTDTITYTSSDTNVATVTADGKVTAVGSGECVIAIVCGDIAIECKVVCDLAPSPTEPQETDPGETEPDETEPEADEDFKLNREDFTIAVGESWLLYNGPIDVSEITWASSNTSVATVVNGRVRGVGVGQCWITAEYKGIKLKCIVYVT